MVHSENSSTFEARVKWAMKNRQVYTYEDTVELNIPVPKVAIDDDNDDIEDLQRKYERRYRAKKEEKARAEESKKKDEEEKKMLQELLRKFPDVQLQATEKKSNSGPSQSKQRCDVDNSGIPVRPMKIVKVAAKSVLVGDKYDMPCDRCKEKKITCHKQNPVKTCCYECHKVRQSCSFVPTAKGIPRGGNRKRSQSQSLGSSDEEDSPIPTGPRQLTCNLGSTPNENMAELITMLNTTLREGFKNLQKAVEKCADNGHLINNQGSNKRPSTRGSSPVC